MKKVILFLSVVLLILAYPMTAVGAVLEGNKIIDEEAHFEFTFPEEFKIITADNIGSFTEYFEKRQIDPDRFLEMLKDRDIKAYAFTEENKKEVYITSVSDRVSKNTFDIDRVDKEWIEEYKEDAMNTNSVGLEVKSSEEATVGNIKFLRTIYYDESQTPFMGGEYYTIKNGFNVNVVYYNYVKEEYENTTAEMEKIIAGMNFTEILSPSEEIKNEPNYNNYIVPIVMGISILGIIVTIVLMIVSDKNRKKKIEAAQPQNS